VGRLARQDPAPTPARMASPRRQGTVSGMTACCVGSSRPGTVDLLSREAERLQKLAAGLRILRDRVRGSARDKSAMLGDRSVIPVPISDSSLWMWQEFPYEAQDERHLRALAATPLLSSLSGQDRVWAEAWSKIVLTKKGRPEKLCETVGEVLLCSTGDALYLRQRRPFHAQREGVEPTMPSDRPMLGWTVGDAMIRALYYTERAALEAEERGSGRFCEPRRDVASERPYRPNGSFKERSGAKLRAGRKGRPRGVRSEEAEAIRRERAAYEAGHADFWELAQERERERQAAGRQCSTEARIEERMREWHQRQEERLGAELAAVEAELGRVQRGARGVQPVVTVGEQGVRSVRCAPTPAGRPFPLPPLLPRAAASPSLSVTVDLPTTPTFFHFPATPTGSGATPGADTPASTDTLANSTASVNTSAGGPSSGPAEPRQFYFPHGAEWAGAASVSPSSSAFTPTSRCSTLSPGKSVSSSSTGCFPQPAAPKRHRAGSPAPSPSPPVFQMVRRAATRRLTLQQSREVVTYNMNADGAGWIGPSPETMAFVKESAARDEEREEEEKRVRQRRLASEVARQEREREERLAAWAAGREQREVDARSAKEWQDHFARAPSAAPTPSLPPTASANFKPSKSEWHVAIFDTEAACEVVQQTHRTTVEASVVTVAVDGATGRQKTDVQDAYQGFWALEEGIKQRIRDDGKLAGQVRLLQRAVHGIQSMVRMRGASDLRHGLRHCLEVLAACDQVVARDPGRENRLLRDLRADPNFSDLHDLAAGICVYEIVDLLNPLDAQDPSKSLALLKNRPAEWAEEADRHMCGAGQFGDQRRGPHCWWEREAAEDFALRRLCKQKGGKAGETGAEARERSVREAAERAEKRQELDNEGKLHDWRIRCHCGRRDCFECAIWGKQLGWNKEKLERAYHSLRDWRANGGRTIVAG
jgi:hypothetical protein